ncbi:four helix bundle protein [Betaproteobacteria bacterium]|nr:four helix bundle protein [Betaproteobacteria bacterium]
MTEDRRQFQKTEDGRQRTDMNEPTIRDVEDLNVYRKAYQVSLEIHRASLQFPKIEQAALADQMRRASKSVCANLAEGFGKQSQSKAEFKRYLLIAMGSADEMRVWINYCKDLGYIAAKQADIWRNEYQGIARMLNGLHSKWG